MGRSVALHPNSGMEMSSFTASYYPDQFEKIVPASTLQAADFNAACAEARALAAAYPHIRAVSVRGEDGEFADFPVNVPTSARD